MVLDAQPMETFIMKCLILSDGRMGHLNQSIALAKYLEADYDIVTVSFKDKYAKWLSYLCDFLTCYYSSLFNTDKALITSYDYVISAGSNTYYAAKTISKQLNLKSITMMLPKGYRYNFDIIFAQQHDHPPRRTNIIPIVANFSYPIPSGHFQTTRPSIGIVIGGNNAHFTMQKELLKHQLDSIFRLFPQHEIVITTSPRTPKEIEYLIQSYPFAYTLIYSNNPINPIPDFLNQCERVFITIDSTSMVSEAISFGDAFVEILPLKGKQNTKFSTFVKQLQEGGFVHLFDGTLGNTKNKIHFRDFAQKILL